MIRKFLIVVFPLLATVSLTHGQAHQPSLLLDPKGIAELKERAAKVKEVEQAVATIRARVDASLAQEIVLPPRGANWYHWYVCPDHGNRLQTGKRIGPWQWEHVCPVDKKAIPSDPAKPETDLDGCAISSAHSELASLARDAGLIFQVTGDEGYAKKARQILLAYAEKYADYPLHTIRGEKKIGGGKVGSQTLDESVWLIPMAQAADLVWGTFTEEQRKTVAEKLLLPAARDVILPHKMSVHNIQCWKNSAVGLVGFLLKDKQLIDAAIDDPKSGYRLQLAKGVSADGLWWEGAWGYHFYTVSALLPLAEAARNNGVDLYVPELKRMLDAPIDFAMPNGVLPNFNDSGESNVSRASWMYEIGLARFNDKRYVRLLDDHPRTALQAVLFGVFPLPAPDNREPKSANHTGSGYAILRRGADEQATWLCLDYGPHGGGHGHPDKLGFVLYARGMALAIDAGITSYGSPLHGGWYRTTIAHNTLCVDEDNQKAAEGRTLAFGSSGGADYIMAEAGKIADDVRFVRTAVLLDQQTILFVDQVSSTKERLFDVAYHQRGKLAKLPEGTPWKSEKPGYRHLRDGTSRAGDAPISLAIEVKSDWMTQVTLAGGAEVITAMGIGSSTADRVPTVIQRKRGSAVALAWCVSLEGKAVPLKLIDTTDAAGKTLNRTEALGVEVQLGTATRRVLINSDQRDVRIQSWNSGGKDAVRVLE